MTEQEAFHKAAQDAGYESWEHAKILGPAHANEILARHKAEQALADHKADVSEELIAWYQGREVPDCFRRFILPTPDPLVEAKNAAIRDAEMDFRSANLVPKTLSECLDRAFAKHGLKLERIDQ